MRHYQILVLAFVFATVLTPAHAARKRDSSASSDTKTTKEEFREIGHAFKNGGRAIGHIFKKGAKAVERAMDGDGSSKEAKK